MRMEEEDQVRATIHTRKTQSFFKARELCNEKKKIYSKYREMENQEIKPTEIGKKRTTESDQFIWSRHHIMSQPLPPWQYPHGRGGEAALSKDY